MRTYVGARHIRGVWSLLLLFLAPAALANTHPVARSDQASVPLSTTIDVDVLANDSDPDGDPIRLIDDPVFSGPSHGTVVRLSDTTLRYTPTAGYRGSDAVYYRITDGAAEASAALLVQVGNRAPVAVDDFADVAAGGSVDIDVLANDSDPDGDPISRLESAVLPPPAHGTVVWLSNGVARYTPNAGYSGPDTFRYVITDGHDVIAGADVFINDVNHPPHAVDDALRVEADVATRFSPTANDWDADGDTLRFDPANAIPVAPTHGTVALIGDRTIEYTPDPGFTGTDSLVYQITDGEQTASATVTLTVEVFLPPVANDDQASTREGRAVSIDVVANDTDPDGPFVRLVFGDPVVVPPGHGATTRLSNNRIRYTPTSGFSGTDSFRYMVTDGQFTDTATVNLTVADNLAPVAVDDEASTRYDTAAEIPVLANDSDPEGDPIRLVAGNPVIVMPSNGTTTRVSDTRIRYTPNPGFEGTDHFRYRITDGSDVASALVTVEMRPNLPPVAVADRKATPFQTPASINVVANDRDDDGDALALAAGDPVIVAPANGTTERISDTTIRYTPAAGFRGTDTFRYRVTDGFPSGNHSAIVTVRVDNQVPIAADDAATLEADSDVVIDVVANDRDDDGDPLTLSLYTVIEPPNHGTRVRISDTEFRYTPNAGYVGTDSFRYAITDGWGTLAYATVNLTMVPANRPPRAVNDRVTTDFETALTRNVLANDSDPDGDAIAVTGIVDPPSNGAASRVDTRRVRYVPNNGFSGEDRFTYRIEDARGATDDATVIVTVESIGEPEITDIERDPVPRGQTKLLVINGRNLEDAQVSIGTLPVDPGDPPRVYPTAELVSVNDPGTRMVVRVDATAAGIDGFYTLGVETPGGTTATSFRVVGPAPVIDVWTPSEPVVGRVQVVQILGVNLRHADIVPMNSGVRILELDNSDAKGLSGLMFVSASVPPGEIDLRIDGTGGSTMIPVEVRPEIRFATQKTEELAVRSTGINGGQVPRILIQDPISAWGPGDPGFQPDLDPDQSGPSSVGTFDGDANRGFPFCLNIGASRIIAFNAILFSLLDDVGDPITREAINALLPGQGVNFDGLTLAISAFIRFDFSFRICSNGFSDVRFCISGGISAMVPAVGGWQISFLFCTGSGGRTALGASGRIDNHRYTTNNGCVQGNDLEPPGFPQGQRRGRLDVSCCENAAVGIETSGVVFDRPFSVGGPIFQTELACVPPMPIELKVEEVSFLDDLVVKKDQVGNAAEVMDPVWKDPDLDGQPMVGDNAVAYVRNRPARVRVKLVADRVPDPPVRVTVRATSTGGITFESAEEPLDTQEIVVELQSTGPLPNRTEHFDPLDLDWTYVIDGGQTLDAGRTSHPFFITLAPPVADPRRNLTVTALTLGVGTGGVSDDRSAFSQTWSAFAGPADVTTWQGRPLAYYPQNVGFNGCATNALALLTSASGAGQCGSFAHLLLDALAANGIAATFTRVEPLVGFGFMVKEWDGTPSHPGSPYPFRVALRPGFSMVPLPFGSVFGDVSSLSGLRGQNSPTPSEKSFARHFIVRVDLPPLQRYYDPSYGQSFNGPEDFQQRSLWGFTLRIPSDPAWVLRARQQIAVGIRFTP